MCGIAGCVDLEHDLVAPTELVAAMTDALRHRGPDDAGMLSDGPVTLGHRRLSIIDLSAAGHQPMPSHDGTLWLIFNGEIYNYIELRDELRALGRECHTASDTRSAARRVRGVGLGNAQSPERHVRVRDLGQPQLDGAARARPLRGEAALLHDRGWAASVRFGDQGLYSLDEAVPRRAERCARARVSGLRPRRPHCRDDVRRRATRYRRAAISQFALTRPCPPQFGGTRCSRPRRARSRSARGRASCSTERSPFACAATSRSACPCPEGMDSSSVLAVASTLRREAEDVERAAVVLGALERPRDRRASLRGTGRGCDRLENAEVLPSFDGLIDELDSIVWHMDEPFHSPSVYGQRKVDELARNAGVDRAARRPGRRRGALRLPPLPLPPAPARPAPAGQAPSAGA